MKQFYKIGLGGAAVMALAITFAIGRTSPAAPVDPYANDFTNPITQQWADRFEAAVREKYNIAAAQDLPRVVPVERIVPDAPAKVPPVLLIDEDAERPAAPRKKRSLERRAEVNICTRHGKKKVEINGGKSWRCR
jgi:hypothetical protein